MSCYVHSVPGRLRVRLYNVRKNPGAAEKIKNCLLDIRGIRSVDVSTLTGSVTINYDANVLSASDLLAFLNGQGFLDLTETPAANRNNEETYDKITNAAAKALVGLAIDRAFAGSPLGVISAFI